MSSPAHATVLKMPLVSVIIPTLGQAKLLLRSVKSALAQTMTDLEVIVMIDRPNPEAMTALAAIADKRLRVIAHEDRYPPMRRAMCARRWRAESGSRSWTMTTNGCRKSSIGNWPWPNPSMNRSVICSLSYIATRLTRCVWPRRIYDNTIPIDEYLFDRRSFFKGDTWLQTSSLLLRRDLFDSLKFNYEHDDWDFLLRAVNGRYIKVVTVAEPLVIVYTEEEHETTSTKFPWRSALDWIDLDGGRRVREGAHYSRIQTPFRFRERHDPDRRISAMGLWGSPRPAIPRKGRLRRAWWPMSALLTPADRRHPIMARHRYDDFRDLARDFVGVTP